MDVCLKKRCRENDSRALDLQLANLTERTDRLTDALLDGLIDKAAFTERRLRLIDEKRNLSEAIDQIGDAEADRRLTRNFLELANNVTLLYQTANVQQKRRLAKTLFSNRTLQGKNLCLTPQKWLSDKRWAVSVLCGAPDRDRTRIKTEIEQAIQDFSDCTMDRRKS